MKPDNRRLIIKHAGLRTPAATCREPHFTTPPAGASLPASCLTRCTYDVQGSTSVARGQDARSDLPCRQKKRGWLV